MSKFFYYDKNSGFGYELDEEKVAEGEAIIGEGVAVAVVWALRIWLALFLLASPFIILLLLGGVVQSIILHNLFLFITIGIVLFILKVITKTSTYPVVRILFNLYVTIFALYVVLNVFHLGEPMYAMVKLFCDNHEGFFVVNVVGTENLEKISDTHWFYELTSGFMELLENFSMWVKERFAGIDDSCFNVPFAERSILQSLKAIVLYAIFSIIGIIGFLLGLVLLIIIAVVLPVLLPYALALIIMVLVNKAVFKMKTAHIGLIRKGEKYEKAKLINHDELNSVLNPTQKMSYHKRVQVFERVAIAGNPVAQVCYARCCSNGLGTSQDDKKAFHWYKQAALQGDTEAQIYLAKYYYNGTGTNRNHAFAKAWVILAMKDKEFLAQHKDLADLADKIKKKTKFVDAF